VGRALRMLAFPVVTAAVLAAVLAIGIIPARAYLDQKQTIVESQDRLDTIAATNDELEAQVSRLGSDAEIEKVAREQYGLVKPGEEVYHILPTPQDPVAVPDAWPFDSMRQRLRASAPDAAPTTTGAPAATVAPASPAAPAAPSTTTTTTARPGR
jgi:cell division protein FtsB